MVFRGKGHVALNVHSPTQFPSVCTPLTLVPLLSHSYLTQPSSPHSPLWFSWAPMTRQVRALLLQQQHWFLHSSGDQNRQDSINPPKTQKQLRCGGISLAWQVEKDHRERLNWYQAEEEKDQEERGENEQHRKEQNAQREKKQAPGWLRVSNPCKVEYFCFLFIKGRNSAVLVDSANHEKNQLYNIVKQVMYNKDTKLLQLISN